MAAHCRRLRIPTLAPLDEIAARHQPRFLAASGAVAGDRAPRARYDRSAARRILSTVWMIAVNLGREQATRLLSAKR